MTSVLNPAAPAFFPQKVPADFASLWKNPKKETHDEKLLGVTLRDILQVMIQNKVSEDRALEILTNPSYSNAVKRNPTKSFVGSTTYDDQPSSTSTVARVKNDSSKSTSQKNVPISGIPPFCKMCGINRPVMQCNECKDNSKDKFKCQACDNLFHSHPKRNKHTRKVIEQDVRTERSPDLQSKVDLPDSGARGADELAAMRRPGEAPPGLDVSMPTGRGRGVSLERLGPASAQPSAMPIAQTGESSTSLAGSSNMSDTPITVRVSDRMCGVGAMKQTTDPSRHIKSRTLIQEKHRKVPLPTSWSQVSDKSSRNIQTQIKKKGGVSISLKKISNRYDTLNIFTFLPTCAKTNQHEIVKVPQGGDGSNKSATPNTRQASGIKTSLIESPSSSGQKENVGGCSGGGSGGDGGDGGEGKRTRLGGCSSDGGVLRPTKFRKKKSDNKNIPVDPDQNQNFDTPDISGLGQSEASSSQSSTMKVNGDQNDAVKVPQGGGSNKKGEKPKTRKVLGSKTNKAEKEKSALHSSKKKNVNGSKGGPGCDSSQGDSGQLGGCSSLGGKKAIKRKKSVSNNDKNPSQLVGNEGTNNKGDAPKTSQGSESQINIPGIDESPLLCIKNNNVGESSGQSGGDCAQSEGEQFGGCSLLPFVAEIVDINKLQTKKKNNSDKDKNPSQSVGSGVKERGRGRGRPRVQSNSTDAIGRVGKGEKKNNQEHDENAEKNSKQKNTRGRNMAPRGKSSVNQKEGGFVEQFHSPNGKEVKKPVQSSLHQNVNGSNGGPGCDSSQGDHGQLGGCSSLAGKSATKRNNLESNNDINPSQLVGNKGSNKQNIVTKSSGQSGGDHVQGEGEQLGGCSSPALGVEIGTNKLQKIHNSNKEKNPSQSVGNGVNGDGIVVSGKGRGQGGARVQSNSTGAIGTGDKGGKGEKKNNKEHNENAEKSYKPKSRRRTNNAQGGKSRLDQQERGGVSFDQVLEIGQFQDDQPLSSLRQTRSRGKPKGISDSSQILAIENEGNGTGDSRPKKRGLNAGRTKDIYNPGSLTESEDDSEDEDNISDIIANNGTDGEDGSDEETNEETDEEPAAKKKKLVNTTVEILYVGKMEDKGKVVVQMNIENTVTKIVKEVTMEYDKIDEETARKFLNNELGYILFVKNSKNQKRDVCRYLDHLIEKSMEDPNNMDSGSKKWIRVNRLKFIKEEKIYLIGGSKEIWEILDKSPFAHKLSSEEIKNLDFRVDWTCPITYRFIDDEESMISNILQIISKMNKQQDTQFHSYPVAEISAAFLGQNYPILIERYNIPTPVFGSGKVRSTGKTLMSHVLQEMFEGKRAEQNLQDTHASILDILSEGQCIYVDEFLEYQKALKFAVMACWDRSGKRVRNVFKCPDAISIIHCNQNKSDFEQFGESLLSKIMFVFAGNVPLKGPTKLTLQNEMEALAKRTYNYLPQLKGLGLAASGEKVTDADLEYYSKVLNNDGDERGGQIMKNYDNLVKILRETGKKYNLELPPIIEKTPIDRYCLTYYLQKPETNIVDYFIRRKLKFLLGIEKTKTGQIIIIDTFHPDYPQNIPEDLAKYIESLKTHRKRVDGNQVRFKCFPISEVSPETMEAFHLADTIDESFDNENNDGDLIDASDNQSVETYSSLLEKAQSDQLENQNDYGKALRRKFLAKELLCTVRRCPKFRAMVFSNMKKYKKHCETRAHVEAMNKV